MNAKDIAKDLLESNSKGAHEALMKAKKHEDNEFAAESYRKAHKAYMRKDPQSASHHMAWGDKHVADALKEETEITELKKFKAAYDVENTPEYNESVLTPYNSNMQKIAEVVDYAQIDMGRVEEAMKEQNKIGRAHV